MRFHSEDVVRAPLDETFAWWTDLREDDAGGVMPPLRHRQIVRRTPEEIEAEDRWSIRGIPMRTRAVLKPKPPNAWEVWTMFRGGKYHDEVRLQPVPGGTQVTMDLFMDELRWPWTWAVSLLRLPLARLFQRDMEAVDRALERAVNRALESASTTPPISETPSGSILRP